jgi:hypothetical protein
MRIALLPSLLVIVMIAAGQAALILGADAKQTKTPPGQAKRAPKDMELQKISYRKSGGFAGISKGVDITVSSLKIDEQRELQQLFEEANLKKHDERTTPGAADVFYYWISATTPKGTYEVKYDDVSLPGSVRPLVRFLDAKSENIPR